MQERLEFADRGVKIGLIFPGQGSQYVGMGKEFFDKYDVAREVFQQADTLLDFDLKKHVFEGSEDDLRKTEITQPAIFITCVSFFKVFMQQCPLGFSNKIAAVAGHSLGEYSALFAANVLDFSTILKLINQRGKFIQQASLANTGKMAAIIGLKKEMVEKICRKVEKEMNLIVEPVNFNSPQQIVIAGNSDACERAVKLARNEGAKRAIILNVSGPFHSKLMSSAAEKFSREVEKIELKNTKIPVVMNCNAELNFKGEDIKKALIKQINNPVLWEKSISKMIEHGINLFIEIGPGRVLRGLLRQTNKDVKVLNIENQNTLEKTLQALKD